MNLLTKIRSPTSSVGTMLSDGIQNDLTTNGRRTPKTITNATTRMIPYSARRRAPLFFPPPERRGSRWLFGASSPHRERSLFILEYPYTRRGPEGRERLALDVLDGHGAEEARVARVGPVVPHHEDLPLRHPRRAEEAAVREQHRHCVGFIREVAVHTQFAVAYPDPVTRHRYDAFNQLVVGLQAVEDYDVPPLGLQKAVDKSVDEDSIADLQRRYHALRRNPERLNHERPENAEDDYERHDENDPVLREAARPALLPATGAARLALALWRIFPPSRAVSLHPRVSLHATGARRTRTPRPRCSRWARGRRSASRASWPGCPPSRRPPPPAPSSGRRSCRRPGILCW